MDDETTLSSLAYDILQIASSLDINKRNTVQTFVDQQSLSDYSRLEIIEALKELIDKNLIEFKEIRFLGNPFDGFFLDITYLGEEWIE